MHSHQETGNLNIQSSVSYEHDKELKLQMDDEMKRMMEVVDSLSKAAENLPVRYYHASKWKNGVSLFHNVLKDFLELHKTKYTSSLRVPFTENDFDKAKVCFSDVIDKAYMLLQYDMNGYQIVIHDILVKQHMNELEACRVRLTGKVSLLSYQNISNAFKQLELENAKKARDKFEGKKEELDNRVDGLEQFRSKTLTKVGSALTILSTLPELVDKVFSSLNIDEKSAVKPEIDSLWLQMKREVKNKQQQIEWEFQDIVLYRPRFFNTANGSSTRTNSSSQEQSYSQANAKR